jgi:hypothetical protein
MSRKKHKKWMSAKHKTKENGEGKNIHRVRLVTGETTSSRRPSKEADPMAERRKRIATDNSSPPQSVTIFVDINLAPVLTLCIIHCYAPPAHTRRVGISDGNRVPSLEPRRREKDHLDATHERRTVCASAVSCGAIAVTLRSWSRNVSFLSFSSSFAFLLGQPKKEVIRCPHLN